jgi:beta-1,4-mannosyl-glycoprotein beta-1,4-N-acetylglucosaminyltransferase
MFYNCIPFYNELDLLEVRLHTMSKYVDKFIICEMDATHSSKDKPFYLDESKERFKDFSNKIVNLKINSPRSQNPWTNENHQRNIIQQWLDQNCKDEDLIIVQDADEILSEDFLDKIENIDLSSPYITELDFYRYYINAEIIGVNMTWSSGPIVEYKFLKNNPNMTLTGLRSLHQELRLSNKVINNCGWHFTFLGGAESISEKIKAYAHQESNNEFTTNVERLQKALKNNEDACNPNGPPFRKIELNSKKFPKYILNNQEKFIEYIL